MGKRGKSSADVCQGIDIGAGIGNAEVEVRTGDVAGGAYLSQNGLASLDLVAHTGVHFGTMGNEKETIQIAQNLESEKQKRPTCPTEPGP